MQYAFSWTTFPTACVVALALSFPGQAQSANNEERPIRALIQDFADARNAHDGITVAGFYSDEGEWIAARGVRTVRGRAAQCRSDASSELARRLARQVVPKQNRARM